MRHGLHRIDFYLVPLINVSYVKAPKTVVAYCNRFVISFNLYGSLCSLMHEFTTGNCGISCNRQQHSNTRCYHGHYSLHGSTDFIVSAARTLSPRYFTSGATKSHTKNIDIIKQLRFQIKYTKFCIVQHVSWSGAAVPNPPAESVASKRCN